MARHRSRVRPNLSQNCGIWEYKYGTGGWLKYSDKIWPYSSLRPYRLYENCYDELHSGPPYETGGPFSKWTLRDDGIGAVRHRGEYSYTLGPYTHRYTGGFVCDKNPVTLFGRQNYYCFGEQSDTEFSSYGDVESWGPTAWNRFKPGKPSADLGVFLGELREMPRMLKTTASGFNDLYQSYRKGLLSSSRSSRPISKAKGASYVADHYLNTLFGWMPFVSDMRRFYQTYRSLEKQIAQLRRDNGQWIRRRGVLSKNVEEDVIAGSSGVSAHWPTLSSGFYHRYPVLGEHTVTEVTSEKVWFSGKFRYWIPNIESDGWSKNAARQLYGANINPSLIWNLTPWSWLVDWVSNVGDVLSNLDDGLAQNLAAKYAYVMGHKSTDYKVDSTNFIGGRTLSTTWHFTKEVKRRVEASPFGFGLTFDMFSERQMSILGALGLSRHK